MEKIELVKITGSAGWVLDPDPIEIITMTCAKQLIAVWYLDNFYPEYIYNSLQLRAHDANCLKERGKKKKKKKQRDLDK